MEPANKQKNEISISASDLKYQTSDQDWGITALYEGYLLYFSGVFNKSRVYKENFYRLLPFLKKPAAAKPKGSLASVDIYSMFSRSGQRAWNRAFITTAKRKTPVGVEDLFLALLKESSVKNLLHRLKVSTTSAEIFLKNYLKLTHQPSATTIQKIPFEAFNLAMELHNHKIGSLMLLGALLKHTPQDNILQAIFTNIGLTLEKLEIFSVWTLNLDFDFPEQSQASQLLYCCRQSQFLEDKFGYYFELPAIEAAVELAGNYYKDMRHYKALQYLVKAGVLAIASGQKIISAKFVRQAATANK